MIENPTFGIEISEDRQHTSIAAAGWLDDEEHDLIAVQLVSYLDGTYPGPAIDLLKEKATPSTATTDKSVFISGGGVDVIIDPHSPAATLIKPLTEAGIRVGQPSTSDVAVAHGNFLDLVNAGRLRVFGAPEMQSRLDAAVRHAEQRKLAGSAAWDRRTAVDSSPLVAVTLAAFWLENKPAPRGLGMAWV